MRLRITHNSDSSLQIDCLSKYMDKSGFTLGNKDDTDQVHATC